MERKNRKNSFKFLFIGLLLACISLFTSCVDYVQSIKFDESGYESYFKLTVSKTLLAASGEEPDVILEDLDGIEDDLPRGCAVNIINDEFDVGFDFRYKIDGFTNPQDAALFQPYLSDDQQDFMIPFMLGQQAAAFESFQGDTPEAQAMMLSYLASTKCRFLVSKSVVGEMEGACFYSDTEYLEIPFYDYGDSWCLEIPLIYFNYRDEFDLSVIAVQGF